MNIIRNGNIVSIDTPRAKYTINYGIHMRGQKVDNIPEGLDCLFLETGTFSWYEKPLECVETLKNHIQYRPVFKWLEQRKIPVVFADLKYKYNDALLLVADNFLTAVQWAIGLRIISGLKNTNKKKSPSDYITHTIVASWLLLPFAANLLHLGSSITGIGQNKSAAFKRFSHRAHPETDLLYLKLRNAVIAEKISNLAKTNGKKSHIGIILGAGHVGIEDMLILSSEERIKFIMKWKRLLKKLADVKYISAITEVNYTGKTWGSTRTFEVESLKKIYS